MFTAYINAAMKKAHYEILPNSEGYFGKIEGLQVYGLMQTAWKLAVKS